MNSSTVVQQNVSAENYLVKCITGVKKENGIHYQVKWAPSWEREDQLIGCEMLIDIFKDQQKHGVFGYAVNKSATMECSPPPMVGEPMLATKKKASGSYKLDSASQCSKKKSSGSYSKGDSRQMPDKGECRNDSDAVKNFSCASSVSAVVGIFKGKDNYTYYRVEWSPTWEKEENLAGCGDLIRQFFRKELGMVSIPGEMMGEELIEIKEEPGSPERRDDNNNYGDEQMREINTILKSQYDSLQMDFEEIRVKYEVVEEKYNNYKKEKESEIEILLRRNGEVRDKFNKFRAEATHDIGMQQKKRNEMRQQFETEKLSRENELRALKEKEKDQTDALESMKADSQHKIEILEKKCEEHKENLEHILAEKQFQIKLMSEKNDEQREQFENYKADSEKASAMLNKRLDDYKIKFGNHRKQKEGELNALTKKLEERRESFEAAKAQKDVEIENHLQKIEELKKKHETYKAKKEAEVSQLQKSNEDEMESLEGHKSAKEADLLSMKRKYDEAMDSFDHYKTQKENEMEILEKKISTLNEQSLSYMKEKESVRTTLTKKNEELQENFSSYKNEKDSEVLNLVNKNEELKDKLERIETEKEKEIKVLSQQVEFNKTNKIDHIKIEGSDPEYQMNVSNSPPYTLQNKESIDMFAKDVFTDGATQGTSNTEEVRFNNLSLKYEQLKDEFEVYKNEARIEIGKLLMKSEIEKGKLDALRDGENKILLNTTDEIQEEFERYRITKEEEHAEHLKKVAMLTSQNRAQEEDLNDIMRDYSELKLQHGITKKKLKRCEEERDAEIITHNEEYESQRKKYKAYKAEAQAETELLAEKFLNLKETYKNYKKDQEKDIDILLKKIESQKEKSERFEEKAEKEQSSLREKIEALKEDEDARKEDHANEVDSLKKKIEVIKLKHEKQISEKELLVELLLQQKGAMTKKQERFTTDRDSEVMLLTKKNADIKKKYENYKVEAGREYAEEVRKNQELNGRFLAYKEEKDEEIKTYIKKNAELKEQIDGSKYDKDHKVNTLIKKGEDADELFKSFQSTKEIEIQNLYHWIWRRSCELVETKANLSAERLKMDFILNNVEIEGTNSILLKDLILSNKLNSGESTEVSAMDVRDSKEFKTCEVLGEYFPDDPAILKHALKNKIVEIETLKSDVKDVTETLNNVIQESCNNKKGKGITCALAGDSLYEPVSDDDVDDDDDNVKNEPVVDVYQGTSDTLGGLYVGVLKKLRSSNHMIEYYKYIYAQEIYTLNRTISERDETISGLQRTVKDNECQINRLQEEIKQINQLNNLSVDNKDLVAKLLEAKQPMIRSTPPVSTAFTHHGLLPSGCNDEAKDFDEPDTSVCVEEDDVFLEADAEEDIEFVDPDISYLVAGTASYYTKKEMLFLFNRKISNASERTGQKALPNSQVGKKTARIGISNDKSAVKDYKKIPYLKLRLRIKRSREDDCEECGDKCFQGIYFKGDMRLHLEKNPFQETKCGGCCQSKSKRFREDSPDQSIDFRYEQKYSELVNEPSSDRQGSPHSNRPSIQIDEEVRRRWSISSLESEHSRKSPTFYNSDDSQKSSSAPSSDKKFKCTECPRSFSTQRYYKNHVEMHKNERECDTPSKPKEQVTSENPANIQCKTEEGYCEPTKKVNTLLKCRICNLQFQDPETLKDHNINIHSTNNRDYNNLFKSHDEGTDSTPSSNARKVEHFDQKSRPVGINEGVENKNYAFNRDNTIESNLPHDSGSNFSPYNADRRNKNIGRYNNDGNQGRPQIGFPNRRPMNNNWNNNRFNCGQPMAPQMREYQDQGPPRALFNKRGASNMPRYNNHYNNSFHNNNNNNNNNNNF